MSYSKLPSNAETPTLFMDGFPRARRREHNANTEMQLAASALVKAAIKRYPQITPNTQKVVRAMAGGRLSPVRLTL